MDTAPPLTWLDGAADQDVPCPVCAWRTSVPTVRTADPDRRGATLSFRRCGSCDSIFLGDQDVPFLQRAGQALHGAVGPSAAAPCVTV